MRRNLTSLFKFILLCALMVVLTVLLYKTFISPHHRYNGEDRGGPVASAHRAMPQHPRQGAFFAGTDKNPKHIKIDWHDHKYIEAEKTRTGIGEHGAPAFLPSNMEVERKRLFDQNGFNALLSDKIALNRSVKDIRHKE